MSEAAKTQPDDFDSAFNDLASLPDEPERLKALADDEPPVVVGNEPLEGDKPPAAEGDEPPAPEGDEPPVAEGDEPPVKDEKPVEKPVEQKAEPKAESTEDLMKRLMELAEKGSKQDTKQDTKPEPEPKAEEPQLYTAEEQEILDSYQKDWPDIHKAEQLVRRKEYRDVVAYVFDQIGSELRPIIEAVQVMAERTHLGDLTTQVPDYGDVRDRVIDWVGTQPGYLQDAYTRVINEGTVEEVADLINRYKQANPTAEAAAQPAKKEPELPTTTKQAAQSLAPVSSKRSAVPVGSDPGDFDSAFARFAEKL